MITLMEFGAPTCGACRTMEGVINKVVSGRTDVTVKKVDVNQESALAARYGVRCLPTVIVLRDNRVIGNLLGLQPPIRIAQLISQ